MRCVSVYAVWDYYILRRFVHLGGTHASPRGTGGAHPLGPDRQEADTSS